MSRHRKANSRRPGYAPIGRRKQAARPRAITLDMVPLWLAEVRSMDLAEETKQAAELIAAGILAGGGAFEMGNNVFHARPAGPEHG